MAFPERFSNLPDYAFPRLRKLLDVHQPGGEPIAIEYTDPLGEHIIRLVSTGLDGSYTDSLAADQIGTWQMQAFRQGTDASAPAESTVCEFTIENISPELLITGGRKFADRALMWSTLDRLHAELSGETYRPQPYDQFRVRDPKPRLISRAEFRDRRSPVARPGD